MYYCANENNINKDLRSNHNYHFFKGNNSNYDLVNYIL